MAWATIDTGTISFGTFTFDSAAITYIGFYKRNASDFLAKLLVGNTTTNDPAVGAMVSLTQNKVKVRLPRGTLTEAGAVECLKGLFGQDLDVSAHSADPGITGANEIATDGETGYARAEIDEDDWEYHETNVEPYT